MNRKWRQGLAFAYFLATLGLIMAMRELAVREWIVWCTGLPLIVGIPFAFGWALKVSAEGSK